MNRFFTLLLAASCLTAVGQVPDYVPTNGLVAWWPLDGNALDHSENAHNGTLTLLDLAHNRFGQSGSALYFGSESDGFVEIPSLNSSEYFPVTYSIWVRSEQLPSDVPTGFNFGALIGRQKRYEVSCGALGVVNVNDNLSLDVWRGGPWSGDAPAADIIESTFSDWVHVGYTMDASQKWTIYLDGVMANQGDAVGTMTYQGSFRIGSVENNDGDGDLSWDGWLDDVGLWNRDLSSEEMLLLYLASMPQHGCTDQTACNYDADANLDDGSCELFTCKCLEGTVWSEELGGCVVANPADINFDGCVQLNDLLDLLSAYGDCAAEESAWQCGDPLEYQGYDYETVQIGEQCWFAENLRAENYRNGESIVYSGSASDWETNGYTAQGCRAAYNDDPMLGALWGYIYNGFAVNDERALCPTGWIVPKNADWLELGEFLGGMNVAGQKMKNSPNNEFAWNGDNSSGFGGYATGDRHWPDGSFNHALDGSVGDSEVVIGLYWSGAPGSIPAQNYYALYEMDDELTQSSSNGPPLGFGAAVRCIKD